MRTLNAVLNEPFQALESYTLERRFIAASEAFSRMLLKERLLLDSPSASPSTCPKLTALLATRGAGWREPMSKWLRTSRF